MDGDFIVLPSGAYIPANCGIAGIDADLNVYEGYDGTMQLWCMTDTEAERRLTNFDLVLLCRVMEARWASLREKHMRKNPSDPIPDPWEE